MYSGRCNENTELIKHSLGRYRQEKIRALQKQGAMKIALVQSTVLSLVWLDFKMHEREWQIVKAEHILIPNRKLFTVLSREVTQRGIFALGKIPLARNMG